MIVYDTAEALVASPSEVVVSPDHFGDEDWSNLQNALKKSGHSELRRIGIDFSSQEITLRGTVSSFYLKQVAQEAIRPLTRGRKIRNQLVVTNHRFPF